MEKIKKDEFLNPVVAKEAIKILRDTEPQIYWSFDEESNDCDPAFRMLTIVGAYLDAYEKFREEQEQRKRALDELICFPTNCHGC